MGRVPGPLPADAVRRAFFLTNGNGKEMRELAVVLLGEEDPLGPSMGYKAMAAAYRKYNMAV